MSFDKERKHSFIGASMEVPPAHPLTYVKCAGWSGDNVAA